MRAARPAGRPPGKLGPRHQAGGCLRPPALGRASAYARRPADRWCRPGAAERQPSRWRLLNLGGATCSDGPARQATLHPMQPGRICVCSGARARQQAQLATATRLPADVTYDPASRKVALSQR